MPEINRIRIANVSWERRIILDEMYDSCDGENMLLNLANGGGKSVLVQMMLQPILPTRRIHNRKIEYYLSRTSAPTYIMLEWKLDNTEQPFYLMTGIAMCSIGQSGDQASRTKYFTFLNYYGEANAYDIRNIPLIEHREGGITYMPYEAARNQLRQAKGDSFQLRCFAFDESEAYRAALRQYGILPEEWKLIADINDKEGGVDELFSACKTSDSLMDRWILKTVSEELSQGSSELTELFRTLMSSILDKEDKLQEKELLEAFSQETDDFLQGISDLCARLEESEKMAGELSGLHRFLLQQQEETERKREELATGEEKQNANLEQIREEEVSEQFLQKEEAAGQQQELLEKAHSVLNSANQEKNRAREERECMEASQHAKACREARERRLSLTDQLQKLRAGRSDEDFNRVVGTLWMRYGELLKQKESELAHLEADRKESLPKLARADQLGKDLEAKRQRDAQAIGRLEQRTETFRLEEEKNLQELSLSLPRNLLGEVPQQEIQRAREELQNRAASLEEKRKGLEQSVEENRAQEASQKEEQETLETEHEAAGIALERQKQALEAFETAERERKEVLERQNMDPALLYDKHACQNIMEQTLAAAQKEWESTQRRLLTSAETLRDCESGNLHTARRFGELLEEAGIVFDTGETYLRRLGQKEQDACLKANPMLPFCFLVSRADLRRLPIADGEALNRICPVMAFEDVAAVRQITDRIVEFPPELRLACLYNERSLRAETREAYAELLQQEIKQQTAVKKHLEEQRSRMEADLRILTAFPYTAESREQYTEVRTKAEETYHKITLRRKELKEEMERNRKESDRTAEALHQNEGQMEKARRDMDRFRDFLDQNAQYVADWKQKRELEAEVHLLEQQFAENKELCRSLEKHLDRMEAGEKQLRQERNECTGKRDKLGRPQDIPRIAEPLADSLPVLEERYQDILSRRNRDEKLLQARIDDEAEAEQSARKSLQRYQHLSPSRYESLSFSEESLSCAEKKERELERKADVAQEKAAKAEADAAVARERLEQAQKSLAAAGLQQPLPKDQIFGDYPRRRQEANDLLRQYRKKQAEYDKLQRELNGKSNSIQRYIAPAEVPPLAQPRQGAWEDIDILRLGSAYDQAKEENGKARQIVWNRLEDLRRNYSDRHPILSQYLKNIPLKETAATYDAYYFVYERMVEQSDRLQDTLIVLRSDLAHLETDKRNIVRHALIQGQNLYDGLQRLSRGSYVKIWPDAPPRQTLKIGIPEALDGSETERMTSYVENCIATLRAEKSEGALTEETLRKRISSLFSDRELLSQVTDTAHIPVWLYKVDRIPANSKLRTWEEVLVENSGGELFVSCFVLVSALMSYRRDSIMGKNGVKNTTRAFLIDNPFGKTSSRHLLEAMLRIADRFHTQMICLSDLSQSSITNRFALIYQISVRQALYSRNSYLKTDEVRRNGSVRPNERLEHAVLRTPSEQMSLFQEQL